VNETFATIFDDCSHLLRGKWRENRVFATIIGVNGEIFRGFRAESGGNAGIRGR